MHPASGNIVEALLRILQQQQVNALALQPMVVIQPVSVDQRYVALTVLGDDLLGTCLDLIGQIGKIGTCLGERHHVIRRKGDRRLPN